MPLPKPKAQESQSEYMARCMPVVSADPTFADNHDQQVAVCLRTFRDNTKSVKVLDEATGKIGGWGIPFGGPIEGKDLEGESFGPDTNFCFDWFPNDDRPLLYEHGMDSTLGLDVIGRQTAKFIDPEKGVWVEAQLNMAHRYASLILDLAKKGVLGFSSGAMGGYVRRNGSKIMQWPWIEETLTPRPANPYALIPADAVKHFEMAGLEIPEGIKAMWDTAYIDNLPDSSFAWIEDGGTKDDEGKTTPRSLRHLPYKDAQGNVDKPHLRNALARVGQMSGVPQSAKDKLQRAAEGADVGQENKQMIVDDATLSALGSLIETIENATDAIEALLGIDDDAMDTGMKAAKAGRMISAKNMQQIHDAMGAMNSLHSTACDMGENCPMYSAKRITRVGSNLAALIQHMHDQNCHEGKNCPMAGDENAETALMHAAQKRRDARAGLEEVNEILRLAKTGG